MINSSNKSINDFERKQFVFVSLGLVVFIGISIVANSLLLYSVAEQTTNFISRMIQTEDFREVSLTLHESRFQGFQKIQYQSVRHGRSFALPATTELIDKNGFLEKLMTESVQIKTHNPLQSGPADTVIFEYNRFRLVPYAIFAWLILVLISIPQTRLMKKKLIQQFNENLINERTQIKANIARQVRHNLRTPLAALMRIPSRLPDSVRVDRELLSSSISQIRAITAALDDSPQKLEESGRSSKDIYDSLHLAIREISLAIPRHIHFSYEVDDSIVSVQTPHIPHELRAALGNIVNNAIDAIGDSQGHILVQAKDLGTHVQITIEDSGCGIPNNVIDHIFEDGFSYGKSNGTGIGLHHAKAWITRWGGKITASSPPTSQGTQIEIQIPIIDRTSWYLPRLKFAKDDVLFILDDQISAHHLWRIRLEEIGGLEQAKFVSTEDELSIALKTASEAPSKNHFLFDYDISSHNTGLDLLKKMPNDSHKYLVTGHFDLPDIRQRCGAMGVYLLPKSDVATLPIVIV